MPAALKIFSGPPGTGKTWSAAREAVRLLMPEDADRFDDDRFEQEHRRLVHEGRIIWVTFHPSYTYEDFVEGFRPEVGESGNIEYRVMAGPFLDACLACKQTITAADFTVGEVLPKAKSGHYTVEHVDSGGVVLRSEDDRSNRVNAFTRHYVDFYTLRLLREVGATEQDLMLGGGSQDKLDRRQELAKLLGLPTTFFPNSSPHAAVYRKLNKGVSKQVEQDIVLIIDEINRADLSRVFGELMTLLEFDKREGGDQQRSVRLTYSRRDLVVPKSLSVLGTMNTVDKSLSSVDLALRRRFEFVEVQPDPQLVPERYAGINVRRLFTLLNERLGFFSGRDNLIGHADFMRSKLRETRLRTGLPETREGSLRTLAFVLRRKTIPLLADLLRGDWGRLRAIVGKELFEEIPVPDGLNDEDEGATFGAEETGAWRAAKWWDPMSSDWDAKRFRNALPSSKATEDDEDTLPSAV